MPHDLPDECSIQFCQKLLRDCFQEVADPSVISRDAGKLHELCAVVSTPSTTEVLPGVHGSNGKRQPNHFR